jgi:hypothetical protein
MMEHKGLLTLCNSNRSSRKAEGLGSGVSALPC